MLKRMLNLAQYELLNYPHKSIGYYLARPFNALAGNDKNVKDKAGFANAFLAKAMMDYYKSHVNTEEAREIIDVVKRYVDGLLLGGFKFRFIDDAYVGMVILDLYEITSNERYKKAATKLFQRIANAETDSVGSFVFRPKENNKYIYSETVGYVCPFLTRYATMMNDPNALSLSITQVNNLIMYGMDEKTIIPYHGFDTETGIKYGIIGWGQSVGKIMIGLSEMLPYMQPGSNEYETIRQFYRRLVDKVETYQAEGGLYHWQLSAKDGPADTGASAMILYSIARSVEDKVLIGIHKSRLLRGTEAVMACIQEDGSLPGASIEAKGFNDYPMIFDSFPWALGSAISLLTILEEELTKNNASLDI